jgi:hypothetical protein
MKQRRFEQARIRAADRAQKVQEAIAGRERINVPLRKISQNLSGTDNAPELAVLTDNARLVALVGIQDITDKLLKVQTVRKKHTGDIAAKEAIRRAEKTNWFYTKVGLFLLSLLIVVIYFTTTDNHDTSMGIVLGVLPFLIYLAILCWKIQGNAKMAAKIKKTMVKSVADSVLKSSVEAVFDPWLQKDIRVGFSATGRNPNYERSVGDLLTVWLPRLPGNGGIVTAEVAIAVPVPAATKQSLAPSAPPAAPPLSTSSSLPTPWAAVVDPTTGKTYYVNQKTNETSWEPPSLSTAPSVPSAPLTKSAAERLSEAKALLEAGLISKEMFAEKQASILQNV